MNAYLPSSPHPALAFVDWQEVTIFSTVAVVLGLIIRIWMIEQTHGKIREVLEKRVAQRTGELERSFRLTKHVVTSVSEAIIVTDEFGRADLVNPAARRLFGIAMDHDETNDARRVLDESYPEIHELISTHSDDIAQRRSFTIDVDTSNEKKILEISAAPLDGPLHGNVLVIRDITSALSLLEMKTRFISIVSHEIRTPLTSLAGSLDLLDAGVVGVLPTQAAELVNVAQESTSRLVRLVNDVLDLDRLESQRVDLTLGEQTSDTLIAEVFRTLQPQASRKRVRLVAEPAPDTFVADHDRIVQVLLNLIQNALKFSPPSSTIVVASLRVKNEIQFVVDDEGRGIPADALDGIFEPFAQVETSDDRRNSGTGLGLAISRGIIHRHRGRIWAENRIPVGSRFIFTLPLLPKELCS